jgi:multidrug efflux system membrane fusion protein
MTQFSLDNAITQNSAILLSLSCWRLNMKKLFLLFAFVATAASFLGGCSKAPPTEEPVRAVKVLTVGLGTFQAATEFAGEVRARLEPQLAFRVGGKIIARQVELGQRVKAGQLLAQLDPQDFKLAAEAAKAQASAALTNRDLAASELKRYQDLRAQNFISAAELERRESTLKAAQAQLDQAQSQLTTQLNQAAYAVMLATVDGVVTAVEAEAGQVVAAGTPIFRIATDGPRDAVFAVPEDRLADFLPGLKMRVSAWPEQAQRADIGGAVREVSASADPVTRTFQVKVALDGKLPSLALGSTVKVSSRPLAGAGLQGQSVIKLPTSALRQDGQGAAVWVLQPASMTLRSQAVQIATADGNEAVVVAGLIPGMQVVSAGVHVLSAGQKVTLYQPKGVVVGPAPVAAPALSSSAAVQ